MTDIERKALALVNEVAARLGITALYEAYPRELANAISRAIEQHEAFRQEVSDAVEGWRSGKATRKYEDFIIAKPDPLVEALTDVSGEGGFDNYDHMAHRLHQALAARGLKITNI